MLAKRNTLNIYTDGSQIEDGVGAGIFRSELGIMHTFQLPHATVYFKQRSSLLG